MRAPIVLFLKLCVKLCNLRFNWAFEILETLDNIATDLVAAENLSPHREILTGQMKDATPYSLTLHTGTLLSFRNVSALH